MNPQQFEDLFFEFGNFELTYNFKKDNEILNSKWISYEILRPLDDNDKVPSTFDTKKSFFNRLNNGGHRTIFPHEIVLDLEDPDRVDIIKESLQKLNYGFKLYHTGGKGYHFHLFFRKLRSFDEKRRTDIKEFFIKKFDCDLQKKSAHCTIALPGYPHRKTGKLKELVAENGDYKKNKLDEVLEEFSYFVNKDSNHVQLPGNNRTITQFAKDVGEHFTNQYIVFWKPSTREIVEIQQYFDNILRKKISAFV